MLPEIFIAPILYGPGEMRGGIVGDAGADRIPGAAIDDETVAQREDAPSPSKPTSTS